MALGKVSKITHTHTHIHKHLHKHTITNPNSRKGYPEIEAGGHVGAHTSLEDVVTRSCINTRCQARRLMLHRFPWLDCNLTDLRDSSFE